MMKSNAGSGVSTNGVSSSGIRMAAFPGWCLLLLPVFLGSGVVSAVGQQYTFPPIHQWTLQQPVPGIESGYSPCGASLRAIAQTRFGPENTYHHASDYAVTCYSTPADSNSGEVLTLGVYGWMDEREIESEEIRFLYEGEGGHEITLLKGSVEDTYRIQIRNIPAQYNSVALYLQVQVEVTRDATCDTPWRVLYETDHHNGPFEWFGRLTMNVNNGSPEVRVLGGSTVLELGPFIVPRQQNFPVTLALDSGCTYDESRHHEDAHGPGLELGFSALPRYYALPEPLMDFRGALPNDGVLREYAFSDFAGHWSYEVSIVHAEIRPTPSSAAIAGEIAGTPGFPQPSAPALTPRPTLERLVPYAYYSWNTSRNSIQAFPFATVGWFVNVGYTEVVDYIERIRPVFPDAVVEQQYSRLDQLIATCTEIVYQRRHVFPEPAEEDPAEDEDDGEFSDPFYGTFVPNQPLDPLALPETFSLTLDVDRSSMSWEKPAGWDSPGKEIPLVSGRFDFSTAGGPLALVGHELELGPIPIDMAGGIVATGTHCVLVPNDVPSLDLDPLTGAFRASAEGWVTNQYYSIDPPRGPMFAFPDLRGTLAGDGTLRVFANNDPAVYPGAYDEPAGFGTRAIAYAAGKALFDPATRQLRFVDNERATEARAPDVSIVIHPGERVYGRGLDNTNEPLIGALLILDPLTIPDTNAFSDATFDDVAFSLSDALGAFATGSLTNIRLNADEGLVADLTIDPALPSDRYSPFVDRWRQYLPRIRLLSPGAWSILVSDTETFARAEDNPHTDLLLLHWDRPPDARVVLEADPKYLLDSPDVVLTTTVENTSTGALTLVQLVIPVPEGMYVNGAGLNPACTVEDGRITCTFNTSIPAQTSLAFDLPLVADLGAVGPRTVRPIAIDLGNDVARDVVPASFSIGDNDFDGIPDYAETDRDGDSADDAAEAVMGTNPLDRFSVLRVNRLLTTNDTQRLYFDTVNERRYFLSEAMWPGSPWMRRPGAIREGDGETAFFELDDIPPYRAFRIEVEHP